jgi:tetratricopeptide (TPR) repeat protein
MISLFGFFTDWLISRDWRRTLLVLLMPLSLLLFIAITGIAGGLMNKEVLAQRYLNIGEAELAELGDDWAYDLKLDDKVQTEVTGNETKIARFTAAVFKRAQQLDQGSQRVKFVIGAILAQQGLIDNAIAIMNSLAPNDRAGYLPAHAWLASYLLGKSKSDAPEGVLSHHLSKSIKWEQVPAKLISEASRRASLGQENSLDLATQAAEKDSAYEGALLRLAIREGNVKSANHTADKILARLESKYKDGSATASELIDLAEAYFYQKRIEDAVKVLESGRRDPRLASDHPRLRRTLSELFRVRFVNSLQMNSGGFTADMGLLDAALKFDPSNPSVAEEVAKLARIGGDAKPNDALIEKLNEFLAEGKATHITHAWIAEAYLLRDQWEKAIEHWNLILMREPNYAKAHNNLAYALALRYPERMQEALEHSKKAVSLAPLDADCRDTLAYIYLKTDKLTEARSEIEYAIELKPGEIELHKRAIEIFETLKDTSAAKAHMKRVETLEKQKDKKPQDSAK